MGRLRRRVLLFALAAVPFILGSRVARAEECKTPLPTDYRLTVPGDDVPEEYRSLVGVWGDGKWDGRLCTTLVVEAIDAKGIAAVIYSFGAHAGWGIRKPGYHRVKGEMKSNELHLKFSRDRRVTYRLDGNRLKGKYFSKQGVSNVSLSRINP
jgi:hypothetical protein